MVSGLIGTNFEAFHDKCQFRSHGLFCKKCQPDLTTIIPFMKYALHQSTNAMQIYHV
jgi:hypothetical protein